MSTNRFYWIWALRSRAIMLVGFLITAAPFWIERVERLQSAGLISLAGMAVMIIGLADGWGLIQRKKVREAIYAHDMKRRGLSHE